jgi:hypothetical protein
MSANCFIIMNNMQIKVGIKGIIVLCYKQTDRDRTRAAMSMLDRLDKGDLIGENPQAGREATPHQTLIKGRKYKGGRKCHRMVALSVPMMLLWSHSFLKINSMLV